MKEQYTSYSAIQLAGEDMFIAWVVDGMHNKEWEEWLQQHAEFRGNVAHARQIVLDMMQVSNPVMSDEEKHGLWNRITSDISISPAIKNTKSSTKLYRWISVAAAAAILALVVWATTKQNVTTVLTQAGQQKEIQLPENSEIQLNAGSKITFNEKRFSKDRELTLTGEAFFKVQPGSRFKVNTPQGSITVLGTSFNVIAWPDRFEVSCYTGKVRVENQNKNELTITPGERCKTEMGTKKLSSNTFTLASEKPEWMQGKFVFDNQPLKIVVEELERQYNITVKLQPGLEDLPYVGLFESGDLDEALHLITWPKHLKAEKQGNTVLIGR
jgi:transmembrane sensor